MDLSIAPRSLPPQTLSERLRRVYSLPAEDLRTQDQVSCYGEVEWVIAVNPKTVRVVFFQPRRGRISFELARSQIFSVRPTRPFTQS